MSDRDQMNSKAALPAGVKATLAGGAATYLLLKAGSGYGWMLRPPGAVAEDEFLKKCLRCGRCAHVCPYDAVNMGKLSNGLAIGTPVIGDR